MRYRLARAAAPRAAACLLMLSFCSGCALLNGWLDPTRVGRFPAEYQETGIRQRLTLRDAPSGPANAEEPTPADLIPVYREYALIPGDILTVAIMGLVIPDMLDQAQLEVSPAGTIRIPQLGSVKVAGLTEQEAEEEIKARLREAQILPDPDVRVFAVARRGRVFTIRGSVGRAGQYPIADPNLRLLDVIGIAQDIGATVQKLYVIRRDEDGWQLGAPPAPEAPPPIEDQYRIPPPDDEEFQSSFSFSEAGQTPPAEPPAPVEDIEREELEAVIEPPAPAPIAPQPEMRSPPPLREPMIFDPLTGELVAPEAAPPPPVAPPPSDEPFDWEDVPELELEQRVIEIDVRALLAGDPRYNIVIRDRDLINVPVDTGLFYLMGEINRPGVYAFNGRDITIKQAIAMAGGLSPLAWPQRVEIIRHEPGTDKQLTIPVNVDAIFAGLEEDVYLRDDDIVNIGTSIVSPFLFVIRNSFRFTYGFGFVYDRNFADKDAYNARVNPETVEQLRRQQRGLPF